MKSLIIAAAIALSGCSATQGLSAKMPGTFMHKCMQAEGATLEACKQKEWKEFNGMVDAFAAGGDCDAKCQWNYKHSSSGAWY